MEFSPFVGGVGVWALLLLERALSGLGPEDFPERKMDKLSSQWTIREDITGRKAADLSGDWESSHYNRWVTKPGNRGGLDCHLIRLYGKKDPLLGC